ncbi:hypothetical protein Zmor_000767 [Zophobas morio]|uniref:CCHC-type domain-containing protein n=1 Tax=Zophobas morio TaxID=2755281 RepID=A0AA38J721_9CUCU|nr:hypothetical protein Zmor_000767 [Zophobas morio]
MAETAFQFPAKDQAIVMNAVSELKLTDYVIAIGNLMTPKDILFASRMSNDRVCIYLSNKALVDQIVSEQPALIINGIEIKIRRLLNPAKRIILSNVCPTIPHSIVENQVKMLGFTAVSPMTFLRAGIQNSAFSHVLSFRRQIYVQPSSISLPSSVVLKYDDTNYRLFLSFDDVCFKCKAAGHYAVDCPNVIEKSTSIVSPSENAKQSVDQVYPSNKRQTTNDDPDEVTPLDLTQMFRDKDAREKRKPKKMKISDSLESLTPTSELLTPVRQLIDNSGVQYPVDFNQFVEFMDKVIGDSNVMDLINKYTTDVQGMLNLLYDVYPLVEHKSIKNKCLKAQRKLKKAYANFVDQTADPVPPTESFLISPLQDEY